MARLEAVTVEELEDALVEIEGYREVRRLLAAIIYKRGPSVPMLAGWLDMREATIYAWLDRLEAEPILEAVRDNPRSGRPSKLVEAERERFEETLQKSPLAAGYDARAWSPALARQYLIDEFGTEYSLRHVRRMMNEAGLSW